MVVFDDKPIFIVTTSSLFAQQSQLLCPCPRPCRYHMLHSFPPIWSVHSPLPGLQLLLWMLATRRLLYYLYPGSMYMYNYVDRECASTCKSTLISKPRSQLFNVACDTLNRSENLNIGGYMYLKGHLEMSAHPLANTDSMHSLGPGYGSSDSMIEWFYCAHMYTCICKSAACLLRNTESLSTG